MKIVENTRWNTKIAEAYLVVDEEGEIFARCVDRETAETIINLNNQVKKMRKS